jgi:hypothetical protein
MANALPGKLLGIRTNGKYWRCQTAGDLTLTGATTDDDTCKPDQGADQDPIGWVTRTVDSKDWTMTFSAKAFADGLDGNIFDLANEFIDGDLNVEADFMTNPDLGDGVISTDYLYSGTGLLTGIKINGPEKGSSTGDITITGNGPLSHTEINRTT